MDAGKVFTTVVIGIISLVLLMQLGTSVLAPSVTSASNTTAITGYSTWSAGTQSTYSATPGIAMLVYFLFFFVILIAATKAIDA